MDMEGKVKGPNRIFGNKMRKSLFAFEGAHFMDLIPS